jgi:N-acyl homoserine lactone hydrolase
MIRIHIFQCGSAFVDEALPAADRSRNPLAFTGLFRFRHRITVPVRAYLIETPSALVLVDTGWDTRIRTEPGRYEGVMNHFASPGVLPPGQAVTEHLADLVYHPYDLDAVILTHLDIDHAGGLQLVKDARKILVSVPEKEATAHFNPRYRKGLWQGINLQTFPYEETDFSGDSAITLIPFPGHSQGLTGVKVETEKGFVILAGDCGYSRASWQNLELPGICWNKEQARASLKKLQAYGQNPRCRGIYMTHDPEPQPAIVEL